VRRLPVLLTLLLVAALAAPAGAQQPAPSDPPGRESDLRLDPADAEGETRRPSARADQRLTVAAELTAEPLARTRARGTERPGMQAQAARVRTQQEGVIARARTRDPRTQVIGQTRNAINVVFFELAPGQVAALESDPAVRRVVTVRDYERDLSETVSYIGASDVQDLGFDGTGVTVAVLDSGIDYTHAALGGPGTREAFLDAYGADEDGNPDASSPANRERGGLFPTDKVVEGWDFVGEVWPDGPLLPNHDPIDIEGHGTHVADIIAGEQGVAPGADLVGVKVCASFAPNCSGVALALGMDYALSPSGDPELGDRVDIINLSLGATYGSPYDDVLSNAAEAATEVGVLVVNSAGNSSDNPWVAGSPSGAESILAVAQTAVPSAVIDVVQLVPEPGGEPVADYPAVFQPWSGDLTEVIEAPLAYDDRTAATRRGCIDDDISSPSPFDEGQFDGQIAIVDRGVCFFTTKVRHAADAGAVGVIIANNLAGDPPFPGGAGDDVRDDFPPAFMVFQSDGAALKAAAGRGELGRFDPEAGTPLTGTVTSSSSRGPGLLDNLLKPEIGAPGASVSAVAGSGDGTEAFGGTSGAAPMVSGAAALVLQATGDDGGFRSPAEVKALLMNTAERDISLTDLEASRRGEPGGLAPVTRIGAGEVRADRAVASPAAAWDADRPVRGAALSFGQVDVADTATLTRTVVVQNYSDEPLTYDVEPIWRYDALIGGPVTVAAPDTVTVPAGDSATLDLTLTIDGAALPLWELNSGFDGDNGPMLTDSEFAGHLVLSADDGHELGLPFHVLPRRAGEVSADRDTLTFVGDVPAELTLTNDGQDAFVDAFDLVGTSQRLPINAPGTGIPRIDLRAAGASATSGESLFGIGCDNLVRFGVTTWDRIVHMNSGVVLEVQIDVDGDGEADFFAYTFNGGMFGLDYLNLTYLEDADFDLLDVYFTEHATNSPNVVLPFCGDLLGVDAPAQLDVNVVAFGVDDGIAVTDEIAGTFWVGADAVSVDADLDLEPGESVTVPVSRIPDAGGTGLLLQTMAERFVGEATPSFFASSGAVPGTEAIVLLAEEGDAPVVAVAASNDAAQPDTDGSFTLTRTGDLTQELVVEIEVDGTAEAGVDFAALPDEVAFAAGEQAVTVPVEVLGSDAEEPATVTLTVVEAEDGRYEVGSPATATVTISPEPVEPVEPPEPPEPADPVVRVSGQTRIETAVAVSQATFGDGEAGAVVLARADEAPDALAGTPLAVDRDAPVLLSFTEELHPATAAEIERVLDEEGTVYVLGGQNALSADVDEALTEAGYEVVRLAGPTRIQTAIEIAEELGERSSYLVTTAFEFADALAAGAAAANADGAVLLTTADEPHPDVSAYLAERGEDIEVFAVGGPAVRAYPAATPVSGPTREGTAVEVAEAFFDGPSVVGIARRDQFPDALTGGAHVGRLGGPMLLSPTEPIHPTPEAWICENAESLETAFVYGGQAAISEATAGVIADRVQGEGCG
jgi:subtilisin family serine protease